MAAKPLIQAIKEQFNCIEKKTKQTEQNKNAGVFIVVDHIILYSMLLHLSLPCHIWWSANNYSKIQLGLLFHCQSVLN